MGSIYIREGSTNWWFRYRDANGKMKRRSSGTTIKTLALAELAKLEVEIIEEKAAKGDKQGKATLSSAKAGVSLEERVQRLEAAVHRLMTEKGTQIEFLEAWARSSRSLWSK